MFLLALDTCDARGSIALLQDQRVLGEAAHPAAEDFSSWLLPAVDALLATHSISHADLAGYAVTSGPGSFTGVRVGLTTAKAWAEVYGKPIFPISRLAILAERASDNAKFAATWIDAQRKQVFAALYHRQPDGWALLGDESVIDPASFLQSVSQTAGNSGIVWVSLDPEVLTSIPMRNVQNSVAASVVRVDPPLAASVGLYALKHLALRGTDALSLDANYVRRSDAEIFGKKAAGT
ncbi:MAG TPA: tRNA (adenosine(37)-N6)-threonylcarbamoyltransferase complex dimerization subunit type 1 TsaB [Candidatus Acidoferrum sp.]|nr:tRNA (adenosine(37)-N6)-threonylcarbamoyltransferase complex dimerization subunit type 1 TsaB [Candidatus Acidoferrum sp.]